MTLEPLLAEHPFFADFDASHVELSATCASNVVFEEGSFFFRDGDAADQFYIIREGKVAVQIFTADRGPLTVQTLGEGEILGWSWLVPPYRWRFDARALERTRAIALDGECIRAKIESNHELGYALLKRFLGIMTQRLEGTLLQLVDVYGVHPTGHASLEE